MNEDRKRHPHFTNCRVLFEGFDYSNAHKLKPTGDAHRDRLVAERPYHPRSWFHNFMTRATARRKQGAA